MSKAATPPSTLPLKASPSPLTAQPLNPLLHRGRGTRGSPWPGNQQPSQTVPGSVMYSSWTLWGRTPRLSPGVRLTEAGQLEVVTPAGSLEDAQPEAYQEAEAGRVEVATAYALEAQEREEAYRYGFRVGAYDRSKPLVIDPAVLVYAGYLGGSG